MNRAAVIQAAYFAVIAVGDDPSRRTVGAMVKRIAGKGVRDAEVLAWLRNRAPLGHQTGTEAAPPAVRKTSQSAPAGNQTGTLHAGVVKVLDLETHTTAHAVSARARVEPVRLDDNFGDLENDVISVIANDAAERRDGKIAPSVLDGLRQRLARARDRYGVDAFRGGLEIALDRGKGAAYAAGCMKRWSPTDEPRGSPGLFAQPEYREPQPLTAHLSDPEYALARTPARERA